MNGVGEEKCVCTALSAITSATLLRNLQSKGMPIQVHPDIGANMCNVEEKEMCEI